MLDDLRATAKPILCSYSAVCQAAFAPAAWIGESFILCVRGFFFIVRNIADNISRLRFHEEQVP